MNQSYFLKVFKALYFVYHYINYTKKDFLSLVKIYYFYFNFFFKLNKNNSIFPNLYNYLIL